MKMFYSVAVMGLSFITIGCGSSDVTTLSNADRVEFGSHFMAESEPSGAIRVGEAREKTLDGQEVTLIGLIGGSSKPFVEGLAAFTIVDPKVPCCAADEGCPTPWDYCCETDAVKENIAMVKIVDDSGRPVTQDARDFLSVKELSTVVVKGKAERDDQGNLTVAANKIFVRPGK